MIAAVNGDANARAQVEGLFDTFRKGNWQIVDAIQRIWDGERDVEALTESIDPNSAAIVRRVLTLLLSPSSQPSPSEGEGAGASPARSAPSEARSQGEGRGEGITLEDILNLVIAGAKGDTQAGGQAYQFAQALQHDRNAPPDARALGKGFQNVLEGLRGEEAVQGLPPEAAQIVRAVLEQLE